MQESRDLVSPWPRWALHKLLNEREQTAVAGGDGRMLKTAPNATIHLTEGWK